jgi:hypothetical protein
MFAFFCLFSQLINFVISSCEDDEMAIYQVTKLATGKKSRFILKKENDNKKLNFKFLQRHKMKRN